MTKIKVAAGRVLATPVIFYVIDGEPKESRVYMTTDLNAQFVERSDDSYIEALRRMLCACGAATI